MLVCWHIDWHLLIAQVCSVASHICMYELLFMQSLFCSKARQKVNSVQWINNAVFVVVGGRNICTTVSTQVWSYLVRIPAHETIAAWAHRAMSLKHRVVASHSLAGSVRQSRDRLTVYVEWHCVKFVTYYTSRGSVCQSVLCTYWSCWEKTKPHFRIVIIRFFVAFSSTVHLYFAI